MSAEKENNLTLVPRPPSSVERTQPGAKRILFGIVADTLALVKKESPQKTRTLRIISVDDEDWRLGMLELVISAYFKGVTLQSFRDAEEAWQELLRTDPDLFITDDLMGRLNGEEIVHRLADRKITYPVIVINGYGPERDQWVSDCAKRGVNITMLRAPYVLESLLKALESGLKIARDPSGTAEIAPNL